MRDEPPHGPRKLGVGEWVKKTRFVPELAFPFSQFARPHSFAAAGDHAHAPLAQCADLIHNVGVDGTGKLIGDVGDGGHAAASSDAHSIPATVNISPMTNW